ncbi:hypothetical protein D3C80_2099420 [compost metagenome]
MVMCVITDLVSSHMPKLVPNFGQDFQIHIAEQIEIVPFGHIATDCHFVVRFARDPLIPAVRMLTATADQIQGL